MNKSVFRYLSRVLASPTKVSLMLASAAIILSGTLALGIQTSVLADKYTSQIDSLQAQNNASQSAINNLRSQAASYQAIIDNLQSQITTLQGSIAHNQAEQASLQKQIAEAQKEIDQQRTILASDVKAMYVDGTPSSLELLATSKNLSDFVDKQEYRSRVQTKLQDTLKKISDLQKQLQVNKAQVEELLSEERTQQTQLANDQAQQQTLLNSNENQQSTYVAQVQSNNAQIARIQAERAAALARITGTGGRSAVGSPVVYKNFWTSYSTCGGGYSYCWAGYDQVVGDPWGLGYAHECVHFVADWLTRNGYYVPNMAGSGNANEWIGHAAYVDSAPQVGDVAYMPIAPVGHVGVVTAINGDGTVHIQQMNWPVGGYYSEMDLYITSGIQFLHFNRR